MKGFTCRGDEDASERAKLWVDRFDAVLNMDLPFHKIGIAHLSCSLMNQGHHEETMQLISDEDMIRLFKRAAGLDIGIELNFPAKWLGNDDEVVAQSKRWHRDINIRPYLIAREEGCKFYFGSDAHHPADLDEQKVNAEAIIDMLGLEESDKFLL
jgi:hypothetical protein